MMHITQIRSGKLSSFAVNIDSCLNYKALWYICCGFVERDYSNGGPPTVTMWVGGERLFKRRASHSKHMGWWRETVQTEDLPQ